MLTLLWGLPDEPPLRRVGEELERRGERVLLVDQRRVLDMDADVDATTCRGSIHVAGESVDLTDVSACYMRPHDTRRLRAVRGLAMDDPRWLGAMRFDDALLGWLDAAPWPVVVNRPCAMTLNSSKPLQLGMIRACGFDVPETLVSTDVDAVEDFVARQGEVVYKSASGVRSRVARLGAGQRQRLADVATCPTLFQQHVDGVDVRVHVVGDTAMATRVRSDADDYRYAGAAPPVLDAMPLPDEVAARCVAMTAAMELLVVGIDLRVTADGRWYCFEVNPSPAFTYYEQHTGQPVAAAVAALLARRAVCA